MLSVNNAGGTDNDQRSAFVPRKSYANQESVENLACLALSQAPITSVCPSSKNL